MFPEHLPTDICAAGLLACPPRKGYKPRVPHAPEQVAASRPFGAMEREAEMVKRAS